MTTGQGHVAAPPEPSIEASGLDAYGTGALPGGVDAGLEAAAMAVFVGCLPAR